MNNPSRPQSYVVYDESNGYLLVRANRELFTEAQTEVSESFSVAHFVTETGTYNPDPILTNFRNFLDCVKTREQPVCNSTAVRYGHMACFAAAISWKLDRKVTFDPKTESFVNDDEANRLRTYQRRAPYTI